MKDPLLVRNDDPPAPIPTVEFPRRSIDPGPTSPPPAASVPSSTQNPHRSFAPSSQVFGPAFTQALLIVCILMLGIIIGMKLSDYFNSRNLEERELALFRATQSRLDPAPAPTPSVPQVSAPVAPVPVPTQIQATPVPATPPTPPSPDYSDQLAALQQERDLMRQRFETLSGPQGGAPALGSSTAVPPAGSASPSSAPEPSSFLPPRTTLNPAQQRIRDAPSLGKVMEYDTDWHFVAVNCGANHNLTAGQQLAIRRGHEILGLVRLDEVLPDESIANLEGTWKVDAQAPKPQIGDDVLTYPPF